VATDPNVNEAIADPVWKSLWPAFWHGRLATDCFSFTGKQVGMFAPCSSTHHPVAWNVGQKAFDLHGVASLLPLCLLWALGALAWTRFARAPASNTADTVHVVTSR
jgi:hypothetical protein